MATWQLQEEGIIEICGLLEHQISPSSTVDKSQILVKLQHYAQFPGFNNYLAFILARDQGKPVEIRQAAGLLLKNNLRTTYQSMTPVSQQFLKSELLLCLGAEDWHIRSTVGTIVSVIVQLGGLEKWPELVPALVNLLDNNDLNHKEGAMDALAKICEDIPQVLDSDLLGLTERPINIFLPRFIQLFQSPRASLRKLSLGSVNEFINLMPAALYASMDQYLQGLFVLANDPTREVRKLVCAAFVQLTEVRPSLLEPYMRNIMEYVLQINEDGNDAVALEACEFWSAYCDAQLPIESLREVLPRLVPALLSNMVYAEDDESLLDSEEDGSLPDQDEDIKLRCHSSRIHGSEDEDHDDDDIVTIWNLRKCSAAVLNALSNIFGDEILPLLMPFVQTKLLTAGDATWKEREAAIFALGAVAEGSICGLYPHLPEIVNFLIALLDDSFPLIRSITCWTLSRFSKVLAEDKNLVDVTGKGLAKTVDLQVLSRRTQKLRWLSGLYSSNQFILWCETGVDHYKGYRQFEDVLMGLLQRILDVNKRVQEAACSALVMLEEEGGTALIPNLKIILQHLMWAFEKYQRHNLRILYDAIGTLADAVGSDLNQPVYLEILLPPLLAKWKQLSNTDKDLFPLLECFSSIAVALGSGFSQFAKPAFERCIDIIQTQQLAKVDPTAAGGEYDREFIVCSLDLLSGLAEGLGCGMEDLVSKSNLRDLLLQCCLDEASDVRQSAFALVGDIARACPFYLHSRLPEYLDVASKQLCSPKLKETLYVANNACWAIGELAIKVQKDISPVVMTVISCLVPILQHAEELNKSFVEVGAITLGRLAWVCPELVSPHLEHFMQAWCGALAIIRDDVEKEDAFRGLCAVVKANPAGALSSLVFMCKAIASWNEMRSEDLHAELCWVLRGYKMMLKNGAWDQCMSALEPRVKDKLSKYEV